MAYTVSSTKGPTEFAGESRVIVKKVSPDAATGDVTFSELGTVDVILGMTFCEDLTANCYSLQAAIDGTTVNKVNFKLWKAGGTAADTAYLDFHIAVIGH